MGKRMIPISRLPRRCELQTGRRVPYRKFQDWSAAGELPTTLIAGRHHVDDIGEARALALVRALPRLSLSLRGNKGIPAND
jgi:hypothetical protein